MYHVMNRGDRGEDIFQDGEDRKRFLSTLSGACKKTEWESAFLLPNAQSFSSGDRDSIETGNSAMTL